ncbi:DUF3019 domain-containing protein [Psychrosphaera sp. 1_MG-2023]|uniref:DUF3019 domain-containing protein n=1 Tax=Psychrosphaera sp. 1_MG-2023 TaxID=3062643 RepID=UPI0026E1C14B|nr:DUF3019 domain-containing protein [Psychrosphaera sp. 1_MG-2023]MDO6721346.1 DUF3019 domain-containing protein [Psychrosphaera sp. 1_MG-2023]
MNRFALIVFLTCFVVNAYGVEKPNILAISPEMCVTHIGKEHCQLEFNIKVEFQDVTDFCIVIDDPHFVDCFIQTDKLLKRYSLPLTESTYLQIKDKNDELLAAQLLSVAKIKAKKTRPRRNLGWVLF